MDARAKFDELPGVLKMAVVALGGGLSIITIATVIGVAGSLFNPAPQTDKATPLPDGLVQPPAQEQQSEQPTPAEVDTKRYQLWQELQSSVQTLENESAEIEKQLRTARAQRWRERASVECNRLGAAQCGSPFLWLVDQYRTGSFSLRQSLITGKLATDSASTDEFRKQLSTLQDIAAAMTLSDNSPPLPNVAVGRLGDLAVDVYARAGNFEAFRGQEARQNYQQTQPTGGGHD